MAVRKRRSLINSVVVDRQKQLYRLMERYTKQIYIPGHCTHLYSWNVAYLTPNAVGPQYEEFHCYTNNIVFAGMLFEAKKLPLQICINYMEFNYLLQ